MFCCHDLIAHFIKGLCNAILFRLLSKDFSLLSNLLKEKKNWCLQMIRLMYDICFQYQVNAILEGLNPEAREKGVPHFYIYKVISLACGAFFCPMWCYFYQVLKMIVLFEFSKLIARIYETFTYIFAN